MNTESQVDIQNKATSAAEVERFKTNPPDKYFVYIKHLGNGIAHATTFMGDKLGEGKLGHKYQCPAFGSRSTRQSFWFYGINGYSYVGTYYTSSGDYARVRMTTKGKRRSAAKNA